MTSALRFGAIGSTLAALSCSVAAGPGEVGIYLAPDGGLASAESPGSLTLAMTIRDFKVYDPSDPSTNPDFHNIESDRDVAADALGTDGKPVYQAPTNTLATFGKGYFDQWYHDVPGINLAVTYPLTLSLTSDGSYEYDCRKSGAVDFSTGSKRLVFLPIDDGTPYETAFGNQGAPHNYAFTGELHALFGYPGQGSLRVRADDDLYVFIDGSLAINLGGIHGADGAELDLSAIGLKLGGEHRLDIFYAERAGKTGDLLLNTSLLLRPAE